MSIDLSTNAQAILLLTAPLIAGRQKQSEHLLTPGEYNRFAAYLRAAGHEPADLLSSQAKELIDNPDSPIEPQRLHSLLSRGFLLTQAIERWQKRAIWVVTRADVEYPKRLKTRLKEDSPPVLYGCGSREILNTGGLAVVGSRRVDDELIAYTEGIGRLVAESRKTLVSGGAKGIDQAAMRGALQAGGSVAGILADGLEKAAMNPGNRRFLLDDQLVLISPYDPSAGFNVGNAMQRNKLIYALADAALVVNTDLNKGGTWTGANEQLKKYHFVPVYVRSTGQPSEGLQALQQLGAKPWPNPRSADELEAALTAEVSSQPKVAEQSQLSFDAPTGAASSAASSRVTQGKPVDVQPLSSAVAAGGDAATILLAAVLELISKCLPEPWKPDDVAQKLGVTKRQAEDWLRTLHDQGILEKKQCPIRYVRRSPGLFNSDE